MKRKFKDVLVIDDDEGIQAVLNILLEENEVTHDCVATAADAELKFNTTQYKVIIVDCHSNPISINKRIAQPEWITTECVRKAKKCDRKTSRLFKPFIRKDAESFIFKKIKLFDKHN